MASRATTSYCFLLLLLLLLLFFSSCCPSAYSAAATEADTLSWGQSLSGGQTIVSKGGTYELGFFSPGNNTNRYYIGIWYKLRPEKTVVWVANRDKPVSDPRSSELKIAPDGNLVVLDKSKTRVWSSNVTSEASSSTVVSLLETGNLVLGNVSDPLAPYWQSFDHPTDCWLPGSKIGYNNRTRKYTFLTSWKSKDDPSPGVYSYGMDPKGSDQLVQIWNGTKTYWTSGLWNGRYFSEVPEMTRNKVFNYTYFQTEKYLVYSMFDTQIITRLVADISGKANQWALLNHSTVVILGWVQPKLQCQVYSFCGPFSVCTEDSESVCECMQGFVPASPGDWDAKIWGGGCVRRTELQCGNRTVGAVKDKFLPMPNMKLDTDSELVKASNAAGCELACLNNCSCTAYAYNDKGCSIWTEDLRNMQTLGDDASSATMSPRIRLAASDIPPEIAVAETHKKLNVGVILGPLLGLVVVLAAVAILTCRWHRRRLSRLTNKAKEGALVVFRYRDLQKMTNNFSNKLGEGGFGSVFKGSLTDSTPIAVKKLEGLRQGEKQFRTEVITTGRIQHVNLVHLLGFCCEGDKRLLVYEYMPNGSLDHQLFGNESKVLDWKERYQIALGVARGLAYLHEQCRECIIHCDIKPENILLDKDLCPKVADFGMAKLMGKDISRVLTTMRGTAGYLAPEWLAGLAITSKADVYSFGMLVFEVISGRRNTRQNEKDEEEEDDSDRRILFFPLWAAGKVAEGKVMQVLDSRLEGKADIEEVERLCKVAIWCIQDEESHRPSMGEVVQMLEGGAEVIMPPFPNSLRFLVTEQDSRDFIHINHLK
ncbi:uncharacterized protein M6B38_358450 [Iris pallida]|uniref:Receptor-like serine/threonine-protein kinase n=1 Tax=Iris pallida TaxID=29817 RepID=A0AAX6GL91_IRIPA|nr:uncharacterized protein M6B38_358450 [Iris pallida]